MMRNLYIILLFAFSFSIYAQNGTSNYVRETTYVNGLNPSGGFVTNTNANFVTTTYYDGLGRAIQEIDQNMSPDDNKNIVRHIEYEKHLGQVKEYLPFTSVGSTTSGGMFPITSYHSNYVNQAKESTLSHYWSTKYDYTGNPYSETRKEASMRQRVLETASPGSDWSMNYPSAESTSSGVRNTVRMEYTYNQSNEVRRFRVTTIWNANFGYFDSKIFGNGYYPVNSLSKTVLKNENWKQEDGRNNTTEEFKDMKGNLVLKRSYTHNEAYDTYYAYDKYNNLSYVIPPLANGSVTAPVLKELCYSYFYDDNNRMVAKKIPGRDPEYFVYDKSDRVVLSGPVYNPFGNSGKGWLFTKYDHENRVVYTGYYTGHGTGVTDRKALTDLVNGQTAFNERKLSSDASIDGITIRYSNERFPTAITYLLTVNYYDNYGFPNAPITSPVIEGESANMQVKGMATASWTRVLTSPNEKEGTLSYTYYNKKYQPIRVYEANHLGGYTQTDSRLNFRGIALKTTTTHKRLNSSASLTIVDNYTYDRRERLLTHKQKINDQQEELIVANQYDELGVLISKKTGGLAASGNGLQKIDYLYNIRGWLTQINDPVMFSQSTDNDLFSFKINYNRKDDEKGGTGKALYNGNINSVIWKTAVDNISKGYSYDYDALNRLTNAQMMQYHTGWTMGYKRNQTYNEQISYDKNGNILKLMRTGELLSNGNAIEIDDLAYNYRGNRLTKVTDATNNPDGFKMSGTSDAEHYLYDDFGNLISDSNKKILEIGYNHLNLPRHILWDTEDFIRYIYDASGTRISKKVDYYQNGLHNQTDYLGGFQYQNGVLQFFPTTEGYVYLQGNEYLYAYQYKDHLGNVRLSYTDANKNGFIENTEIIEENNYYPFGLKQQGYNDISSAYGNQYAQNYKFGGKEFNGELNLNLYDFGARNYDPAIGRWMNIDPLSENSRRWTPYNYAYNNPNYFVDPDGMQSWGFNNGYFNIDINKFAGAGSFSGSYDGYWDDFIAKDNETETNKRIQPNQVVDKNRTDNNIIVSDDSNVKNGINDQKLVVDNGYDKEGNQINNKGGDTTDYMYDKEGNIISSTSVSNRLSTQWNFSNDKWRGYGWKSSSDMRMATGAIEEDNTIFELYTGGKIIGTGLSYLGKGLNFMKVPVFRTVGEGINKFAPGLNKGKGFRIGISKANIPGVKGTQKVFRATYGNKKEHFFNIRLGKWGK